MVSGSRAPVAGAVVWRSGEWASFARSDPSGRFRLQLPSTFETTQGDSLWAAAQGFFAASAELLPAHPQGLNLLPQPAARVQGMEVDEQGQALSGALIREISSPQAKVQARSGPDGSFILPPLPLDRPLRLQAQHRRYTTPTTATVAPVRRPRPVEVRIRKTEGRLAWGTVVDDLDRPVPDALVTLTPSSGQERNLPGQTLRTLSGDQGRFEIPDLPTATFDISIEAAGYSPAAVPGVRLAATKGQSEVEIGTLILSPAARLEGRVLDPWGKPLAEASIRIQGGDDERPSSGALGQTRADAVSGADGRFVISDLAFDQPVDLRVSLAGYAPTVVAAVWPPTQEDLEILLESAASLAGRVVEASGQPVAAAEVRLDPKPGSLEESALPGPESLYRTATTDEVGGFEIGGVPSGRWDLSVTAPGFQKGVEEDLEVVAGEASERILVVLERGAEVRGRVSGLAESRQVLSPSTRLFLLIGFLGSFTTFSTFGFETVSLAQDGEIRKAGLSSGRPLGVGLFAVWLGLALSRIFQ